MATALEITKGTPSLLGINPTGSSLRNSETGENDSNGESTLTGRSGIKERSSVGDTKLGGLGARGGDGVSTRWRGFESIVEFESVSRGQTE